MNLISKKKRQTFKKNLEGYLFISPWLVGFLLFAAGPILISLFMSFTRWSLLSPPQWIGINNYHEIIFNDPLVYKSIWNTAYYVLFSVPLGVILSLFLAILSMSAEIFFLFSDNLIGSGLVKFLLLYTPWILIKKNLGIMEYWKMWSWCE